jgi:DNA-3-methyladenine glycosylase
MAKYNNFKKLTADFYLNSDVVELARLLLGKVIVKKDNQKTLYGRIVETEAYAGADDRASHAFGNKRTARTETMFAKGGIAYVYLCYGMHHLLNVVTNQKDIPHAVLIRAIEPLFDASIGPNKSKRKTGSGPALVTKYLSIHKTHNKKSFLSSELFIADDDFIPEHISASPRIGVDYAGDAALWPYRFFITGHPHISPSTYNQQPPTLSNS